MEGVPAIAADDDAAADDDGAGLVDLVVATLY